MVLSVVDCGCTSGRLHINPGGERAGAAAAGLLKRL
jgi:hypothetical protein